MSSTVAYKLLKVQGNAYTDLRRRLENAIHEQQVKLEKELAVRSAAQQKEQILLDMVVQSEVTLKLLGASRSNQLPDTATSFPTPLLRQPSSSSDCETLSLFDDGVSSAGTPAARSRYNRPALKQYQAAGISTMIPCRPQLLPQPDTKQEDAARSYVARLLQGATRGQVQQVQRMQAADWCQHYRVCFARLLLLLEVATREDDLSDGEVCQAEDESAADACMTAAAAGPQQMHRAAAAIATASAATAAAAAGASWDLDEEMFLASAGADAFDDEAWLFSELVDRENSSSTSTPAGITGCFGAAFAHAASAAATPTLQPANTQYNSLSIASTPSLQPSSTCLAGSSAGTPSPCMPASNNCGAWGTSAWPAGPLQLQQQSGAGGPSAGCPSNLVGVMATPATPSTSSACSLPGSCPASDMQQLEQLVDEWMTLTLLARIYNLLPLYQAASLNHVTQAQESAKAGHWQRVVRKLELTDTQAQHLSIALEQYLRLRAAAFADQAQYAAAATDVSAMLRELALAGDSSWGPQAAAAGGPGSMHGSSSAAQEQLARTAGKFPLHAMLMVGVMGNTLTRLQMAKGMVASYPFLPLAGAIAEATVQLHRPCNLASTPAQAAPEAQTTPNSKASSTTAKPGVKTTKKQKQEQAKAAAAAAAAAEAAAREQQHHQHLQCSCKCVCHDGQFAARQQQQLQHMECRHLLLEQQQLSWLQEHEGRPSQLHAAARGF